MGSEMCIRDRCHSLEERCKIYEERNVAGSQEDVANEVMERHKRRKYVVVSGLPESPQGSVQDRKNADGEKVRKLANSIGVNLNLNDVTRIGRGNSSGTRLLRVKCGSVSEKLALLKAAKSLRSQSSSKGIYINPDQTFTQRTINKKLRAELKQRREAGENDVIIHRGRVINKSEVQVQKDFQ